MHTDPFKSNPEALARLPRLVRLFIFHGLVGFAIAAAFTALVLWLNVANIGHLVFTVQGGWLAALVFFMLNGIVFSGAQTAIVVMSLGGDENRGNGPGTAVRAEPVRVAANPRR